MFFLQCGKTQLHSRREISLLPPVMSQRAADVIQFASVDARVSRLSRILQGLCFASERELNGTHSSVNQPFVMSQGVPTQYRHLSRSDNTLSQPLETTLVFGLFCIKASLLARGCKHRAKHEAPKRQFRIFNSVEPLELKIIKKKKLQ